MIEAKLGMGREPHLDLLAFMHPEIIQNDMNLGDLGRVLLIKSFQELDGLDLPFAFMTLTIDLAGSRKRQGLHYKRFLPQVATCPAGITSTYGITAAHNYETER